MIFIYMEIYNIYNTHTHIYIYRHVYMCTVQMVKIVLTIWGPTGTWFLGPEPIFPSARCACFKAAREGGGIKVIPFLQDAWSQIAECKFEFCGVEVCFCMSSHGPNFWWGFYLSCGLNWLLRWSWLRLEMWPRPKQGCWETLRACRI